MTRNLPPPHSLTFNHKVPLLTFNLEKLKFHRCKLTSHQLFLFIKSPQPSILKELLLSDIRGFYNRDLRSLLTHVASSLTYLHIR